MFQGFIGPTDLKQDIELAYDIVSQNLKLEAIQTASHVTLITSGLGECEAALAVYFVGQIAQCIHTDLRIRAALFGEANPTRELLADVHKVVGDGTENLQFMVDRRDPWFLEALSHLFFNLSAKCSHHHPPGTIIAKTQVKFDVVDHGLDLMAIYENDGIGLTAGECKAYLKTPGRGISSAAAVLAEIDSLKREGELRSVVAQLLPSLTEEVQEKIARAFWQERRSYFTFIACDDTKCRNFWSRKRACLDDLAPSSEAKFLTSFPLSSPREMFNRVASKMRCYAAGTNRE